MTQTRVKQSQDNQHISFNNYIVLYMPCTATRRRHKLRWNPREYVAFTIMALAFLLGYNLSRTRLDCYHGINVSCERLLEILVCDERDGHVMQPSVVAYSSCMDRYHNQFTVKQVTYHVWRSSCLRYKMVPHNVLPRCCVISPMTSTNT